MATAKLITTLIQLKFSLLCQHPTPTLAGGREAKGVGLGSLLLHLCPQLLIQTQPLDLTLTISILFARVKFWSLGSGRGGDTRARGSVFVMWNHFWPWLVWRENRRPFLKSYPKVSSSRDSKRPKFLPGSHTSVLGTPSPAPESCLTPQLLAFPIFSPASLLISPSYSFYSPLLVILFHSPSSFLFCPTPIPALHFSLLPPPPPLPPRATALSPLLPAGAGVEECVFCFSPVPRPPPPPPANQERAELATGRRHLEARQALYAELQTQLDNCPESVREQLQEQLRRVSFTSPPSSA